MALSNLFAGVLDSALKFLVTLFLSPIQSFVLVFVGLLLNVVVPGNYPVCVHALSRPS